MSKEIEFIATDKYSFEVCPKPFPAASALPQWWRDATPYIKSHDNPDGKKIIIRDRESNASFKKCTPMLDLLTAGYMIPLFADVVVSLDNGLPRLDWRIEKQVFDLHTTQEVEIPTGYSIYQFKYCNPWIPKLPKGYSLLITSPIGYPNLPFKTMSSIIDYDKTPHPLTPPVFLKEGFEGIVEKGTPILQIIPFKRDNWKSKFSHYKNNELQYKIDRDIKSTVVNNYVKNFWEKKNFK